MCFETDRMVQVWEYTVSHGQLLLRATKTENHSTRLDLVFKDVSVMMLPRSFDGLAVSRVEPVEMGLESSELISEHSVFRLKGGSFEGYVVAGAFDSNEDELEYYDPSPIFREWQQP